MLCFSLTKTTRKQQNIKSLGARGFTLVESLIAVAILMVLVIMVFQGFVSTMQYSTNTARYEQSANNADSQINTALSNASNPTPNAGIYLNSASFSKVIPVAVFVAQPTTATNYGVADYVETDSPASSNRHGFLYAARVCPNADHAQLAWYINASGVIKLYCPVENIDIDY